MSCMHVVPRVAGYDLMPWSYIRVQRKVIACASRNNVKVAKECNDFYLAVHVWLERLFVFTAGSPHVWAWQTVEHCPIFSFTLSTAFSLSDAQRHVLVVMAAWGMLPHRRLNPPTLLHTSAPRIASLETSILTRWAQLATRQPRFAPTPVADCWGAAVIALVLGQWGLHGCKAGGVKGSRLCGGSGQSRR